MTQGDQLSERAIKYGLRIGDILQLSPLQGRKRFLDLSRTEYHMQGSGDYRAAVMGIKILLSSMKDENHHFNLKLAGSGDRARYCLESLNQTPFILNGATVYKAILERGDTIRIGHNHLVARAKEAEENITNDYTVNPRVASSNLCILIEGETGSGKSHLAKLIHQESGRRGSFIQLNLSSFGEGLIESELFGHVRGAFTGALRAKEGAISEANYGTLFLDEIDSLPLALQTKLLLFLDSKEFRPVGGGGTRAVDVRIICASGRNLQELVKEGMMRKDFYFRIAAGEKIYLAPLRDKPELIKKLTDEYLHSKGSQCAPELMEFFLRQKWPGNIRQLFGHLEKKIVLGQRHYLTYDELDRQLVGEVSIQYNDKEIKPLEEIRQDYAAYVFQRVKNNKRLAAELLEVSVPTLKSLLDKVGILSIEPIVGVV